MIIETLPKDYNEIVRMLTEDGAISFLIDQKHKKRFHRSRLQLNKEEKLFRKKRNLLNTTIATLYSFYVFVTHRLLLTSSKNLSNALLVYKVYMRHIASIRGEDAPNNKIKVTYYGHT